MPLMKVLIPNAAKTYVEAITFGTTAPTVVDTIFRYRGIRSGL